MTHRSYPAEISDIFESVTKEELLDYMVSLICNDTVTSKHRVSQCIQPVAEEWEFDKKENGRVTYKRITGRLKKISSGEYVYLNYNANALVYPKTSDKEAWHEWLTDYKNHRSKKLNLGVNPKDYELKGEGAEAFVTLLTDGVKVFSQADYHGSVIGYLNEIMNDFRKNLTAEEIKSGLDMVEVVFPPSPIHSQVIRRTNGSHGDHLRRIDQLCKSRGYSYSISHEDNVVYVDFKKTQPADPDEGEQPELPTTSDI